MFFFKHTFSSFLLLFIPTWYFKVNSLILKKIQSIGEHGSGEEKNPSLVVLQF